MRGGSPPPQLHTVLTDNKRRAAAAQSDDESSDSDDSGERGKLYDVESVDDVRASAGGLEFLVRWAGYPEDESTWEPEEGVKHLEPSKTKHLAGKIDKITRRKKEGKAVVAKKKNEKRRESGQQPTPEDDDSEAHSVSEPLEGRQASVELGVDRQEEKAKRPPKKRRKEVEKSRNPSLTEDKEAPVPKRDKGKGKDVKKSKAEAAEKPKPTSKSADKFSRVNPKIRESSSDSPTMESETRLQARLPLFNPDDDSTPGPSCIGLKPRRSSSASLTDADGFFVPVPALSPGPNFNQSGQDSQSPVVTLSSLEEVDEEYDEENDSSSKNLSLGVGSSLSHVENPSVDTEQPLADIVKLEVDVDDRGEVDEARVDEEQDDESGEINMDVDEEASEDKDAPPLTSSPGRSKIATFRSQLLPDGPFTLPFSGPPKPSAASGSLPEPSPKAVVSPHRNATDSTSERPSGDKKVNDTPAVESSAKERQKCDEVEDRTVRSVAAKLRASKFYAAQKDIFASSDLESACAQSLGFSGSIALLCRGQCCTVLPGPSSDEYAGETDALSVLLLKLGGHMPKAIKDIDAIFLHRAQKFDSLRASYTDIVQREPHVRFYSYGLGSPVEEMLANGWCVLGTSTAFSEAEFPQYCEFLRKRRGLNLFLHPISRLALEKRGAKVLGGKELKNSVKPITLDRIPSTSPYYSKPAHQRSAPPLIGTEVEEIAHLLSAERERRPTDMRRFVVVHDRIQSPLTEIASHYGIQILTWAKVKEEVENFVF